MRHFSQLPPLSLYIHLPWCEKKCPYCDFNSHAVRDAIPEGDYIDALLADLALEMPAVWGRKIESVFIGGGTPSLFTADAIQSLLSGVRALAHLHPGVEVTMEANPGSAEREKFAGFRAAGVNRLSLGVQSFSDHYLRALGRVHNGAQALAAVESAQQGGFESINIDLMFALPEQTQRDALADLQQAVALQPSHISCYQLTLEPNTLFHHTPPPLPDDDSAFAMQQTAQGALVQAGFRQYEISAYAQPGQQCVHNRNYWQFGDYLGIGAGAHGKITHPANGAIVRYTKSRSPEDYMRRADSAERVHSERTVAVEETGIEFMLNAMRLVDGVPVSLFADHTGLSLAQIRNPIEKAQRAGLLQRDPENLQPTAQGLLFHNDLLAIFMEETTPAMKTIPIIKVQ